MAAMAAAAMPRTRMRMCFVAVCAGILVWTVLVQLVAFGRLWSQPGPTAVTTSVAWEWNPTRLLFAFGGNRELPDLPAHPRNSVPHPSPLPLPPPRIYKSNGYLKISCNGGLNQMRSEICDMVAVARLLNLTMVVPELDKTSFWSDTSNFGDIFDIEHFINSLRDEVLIVKRLPERFNPMDSKDLLKMPPVSWSDEKYYLQQILPLFNKFKVIHFNRTDARLANNGLTMELQKLRCRVNFHALKFTSQIESLGNKLVQMLRRRGYFVALHLRYEMDMLAFSGCTHGCSHEEAEELKGMRYAYPWWRDKEIDSDAKRLQGLCPLTPEEVALVLQALGFDKDAQIYIAAGEIYGGEERLSSLKVSFPKVVRKEMLLDSEVLRQFRNHSSQMAAVDFMVSVASDVFIPTYDGNMAKVVEGYRRYLGFRKSIMLDRRKLVELLDSYENKTLPWEEFVTSVKQAHQNSVGQPARRRAIANRPKEEDYFYANPYECLVDSNVHYKPRNSSSLR